MSTKTYDVKITAKVTKTIRVDAETEEQAIEDAHSEFCVAPCEGVAENYEEEYDSCVLVEDEDGTA
jgi:hypothetical protein